MHSPKHSDLTSNTGTASGSRKPLLGPDDGRTTENRLHDLDPEARGESLEDHQRDRDSRGLTDGYDDSIDTRKGNDEGHDYLGIARGD
jgi:hypothetical protein